MPGDLCGLRPVAVIHAGGWRKEWEGGHYMDQYVSSAQLFSVSLPPSVIAASSHLFSLRRHLSISTSHLFPHLNPLFPTSRFLFLLSLSPFIFQILLSVCKSLPSLLPPSFTYLSSVPASFPTFLSHGHLPFRKSIFLTLNHCLHHLSPSSISLSLSLRDSRSPSFLLAPPHPLSPSLSKAGVYFCALPICHCCPPTYSTFLSLSSVL